MTSQLEAMLSAIDPAQRVLILPHNNPDPDSIASAVALCHVIEQQLETTCSIAYKGVIGRAENRALLRYLGNPLHRLTYKDFQEPANLAVVDTQPGIGNSAIDSNTHVNVVIDHHPYAEDSLRATFVDVRPEIGATTTILTQYLQAAGIEPSPQLATALFYGIKTDTMGLVRGTTRADIAAYLYLQPLIDTNALIAIENAQVSAAYFDQLNNTVQTARIYDKAITAFIGTMSYPDLVGEMADLLMRLEGMQWCVCMGVYRSNLIISVRTRKRSDDAGKLARSIVQQDGTAGGHGTLAGGQVPLNQRNPVDIADEIIQRTLASLDIPANTRSVPLLQTIPAETYNALLTP